jgi:hypothetical protein
MADKNSKISVKERAIIDSIAKKISEFDIDEPVIIFLQAIKPISRIGGELSYFFLAPYLPLLEEKGYDFLDTFEKRENIEFLIKRIRQIQNEKVKDKEEIDKQSIWNKIRKKLPYV